MKRRLLISQIIFALLIPCSNITAFAIQNEVSNEDVEYSEFSISRDDLENGKKESCKVTVSMPYEYSTNIPKTPIKETPKNNNVQTGDNTNIFLYSSLFLTSCLGLTYSKIRRKK